MHKMKIIIFCNLAEGVDLVSSKAFILFDDKLKNVYTKNHPRSKKNTTSCYIKFF